MKVGGLHQAVSYTHLDVYKRQLLHEDANAHFLDDVIRRFTHVQLGVAVDTPRGLMVPVIRNADTLSIEEIASEVRRLAGDAQSGTINPDEIRGGTITVTNLGGLGIEHFTPVINPPETCILGCLLYTSRCV